ncbi:MAG: hypothetical protein WC867_01050 [Candidatus Pacearchaeota archaeon]|jgi:uncharacterized membrane protein YgcG
MVEIPVINVDLNVDKFKPENLVWGDKYNAKKDKKKIYKILAYLAIIAALIIFFRFALLAYLYIANLPKINSYDANIERIALSDDGKQVYIKLTGGNSKEIESIKFIFRTNESEYFYETRDGIGEISYEQTNSFLSYFAHPEYEGSYDYSINAIDIGLDNFKGIIKVEVSIKYKDQNTGEVKETKTIDSSKKSDINVVRSGGYSGGGGGSGSNGGGSGGGSGSSGGGSGNNQDNNNNSSSNPICSSNNDCNDNVICTNDLCISGTRCEHNPQDNLCVQNEKCNPVYGCEYFENNSLFIGYDSLTGYRIEKVNWSSLINVIEYDNGSLKKIGTSNGYDSSALSIQKISYGFGGYMEFSVNETNTKKKIGFGYGSNSTSDSDLKFAIELNSSGNIWIWATVSNDARQQYDLGINYLTGDKFRIAIEQYLDNNFIPQFKVVYYKNSVKIFEDKEINFPPGIHDWYIDNSFFSPNSSIENVIISYPGNWKNDSIIYSSPNATIYGDGSISRPIDFRTIITNKLPLKDNLTIILRQGIYSSPLFNYQLYPNSGYYIIQPYNNEHIIINGSIIINGNRLIVRNLEIIGFANNSKRVTNLSGSSFPLVNFTDGIIIYGDDVRLINNYVHDMRQGISAWSNNEYSEIYGNIIFNNGWDAPDRGHGHGFYIQNDDDIKRIISNVVFSNLGGYSIHAYTQAGNLSNLYFEKNIIFRNSNLIGSWYGAPVTNLTMKSNYFYSELALGYQKPDYINDFGNIINNYFNGVSIRYFQNLSFYNNTMFNRADSDSLSYICYMEPCFFNNNIDYNLYYKNSTGNPLHIEGSSLGNWFNLSSWQSVTGYDINSQVIRSLPQNLIIIEPNIYEIGRANIIIYNWQNLTSVNINISNLGYSNGENYEIRDIQNYDEILLEGIYDGSMINLPMYLTKTQGFNGDFTDSYHNISGGYLTPTHTDSRFNIFLIRKKI